MTLYILDIIHGKIQPHTVHISSVIVDQIIANLEHRLTWKVASLFSNLSHSPLATAIPAMCQPKNVLYCKVF